MNAGLNNPGIGWREVILFIVLLLILEKGVGKESMWLKAPSESNLELEWTLEGDIKTYVQQAVDWIEGTCSSYFQGSLELDSELFTEENINALVDNWERLVEEGWLVEHNPKYAAKMNDGVHSFMVIKTLLPQEQDGSLFKLVSFEIREKEESGPAKWRAGYERADFSYAIQYGLAPFGECNSWFKLESPRLDIMLWVDNHGFCTDPSGDRIEAEWQNLLNVAKGEE